MPRIARFTRDSKSTVYHVISRTALPGLPIHAADKDYLLDLIKRLSILYCVDVLGFALMGNHFHLVVRMHPEDEVSTSEVIRRYEWFYGNDKYIAGEQAEEFKKRQCSLAAYVKDIKQGFTRYYNKKYNRRGYFWGERFKSMIVEDGQTLVNLLAYVDLNPIRAGVVKRPEDYKWSSLGYHIQTGNKGDLLNVDFGMKEWNEHSPKEINQVRGQAKQRPILVVASDGANVKIRPSGKRDEQRGAGKYKEAKGFRFYLLNGDQILQVASWHQKETADQLADDLKKAAERVPRDKVRVCLIADGDPTLWKAMKEAFPGGREVLDYYHVREYIHAVAEAYLYLLKRIYTKPVKKG